MNSSTISPTDDGWGVTFNPRRWCGPRGEAGQLRETTKFVESIVRPRVFRKQIKSFESDNRLFTSEVITWCPSAVYAGPLTPRQLGSQAISLSHHQKYPHCWTNKNVRSVAQYCHVVDRKTGVWNDLKLFWQVDNSLNNTKWVDLRRRCHMIAGSTLRTTQTDLSLTVLQHRLQ